MTQLELNERLYVASSAPRLDLNSVEELLKLGADPSFEIKTVFCFLQQ